MSALVSSAAASVAASQSVPDAGDEVVVGSVGAGSVGAGSVGAGSVGAAEADVAASLAASESESEDEQPATSSSAAPAARTWVQDVDVIFMHEVDQSAIVLTATLGNESQTFPLCRPSRQHHRPITRPLALDKAVRLLTDLRPLAVARLPGKPK